MKLKSITIKNMHKVKSKTYDLSNITYFYGKNGAGKSTILQAIQLALLGYIPGYNKTNASIFKHSNSNTMYVKLELEDNYYIERTYQKLKSTITCDVVENLPEGLDSKSLVSELELPIFNFSDLVNQSSNQLKKWFIDFLPKSAGSLDWESILSKNIPVSNIDFQDFIKTTLSADCFKIDGVDGVIQVNNYLKALLSAKTEDSKRAINTLQSLIYDEDIYDCGETIESVQNELESLTNLLNHLSTQEANHNHNKYIIDQLNMYPRLCNNILDDPNYARITNRLNTLESEQARYLDKQNQIKQLKFECEAINKLQSTQGKCSYLNCDCDKLSEKIEELSKKYASMSKDIKILETQCCEFFTELSELQHDKAHIENKYNQQEKLKLQLRQVDPDYNIEYLKNTKLKIHRTQELLVKLIANQKYEQLKTKLEKDKAKIEFEIQCLKEWIKITDANHIQNDLMQAPFIQLSDKISSYVQNLFNCTDYVAKFNLSSKSNDFNFGIYDTKQDIYVPYDLLSSGEKCIFAISLMLALIDESSCMCKFILIDDMLDHLDDDKIKILLNAFESKIQNIQLISAGVKPYAGAVLTNIYKL